jgi:hypothetical protein
MGLPTESRRKRGCRRLDLFGVEPMSGSGQARSFGEVGSMSGLPESGSVLRQFFANAAIAASRRLVAMSRAATVSRPNSPVHTRTVGRRR